MKQADLDTKVRDAWKRTSFRLCMRSLSKVSQHDNEKNAACARGRATMSCGAHVLHGACPQPPAARPHQHNKG